MGKDDRPKFTIFYVDNMFPNRVPIVLPNGIEDTQGSGLDKFMRIFSVTASCDCGGFRPDVMEVCLLGNVEYLSYNTTVFWSYLKGD